MSFVSIVELLNPFKILTSLNKKLIIHQIKVWYHILKMDLFGNPIYSIENYPKGKKVYLFLAADYGNLGDVALTVAHIRFFNEHFPQYHVVEIIIRNIIQGIQFARAKIQPGDIVSIIGGGNMGTLYPGLEMFRQIIVETFPKNKIVSFPQSTSFSDDETGRSALKKSISVYSRHKNLILVAREKMSYEFMKQHFKRNTVLITPDIAFSLDETQPKFQRNGVTVSLRRDIEKNLSDSESALIQTFLQENFKEIKHYDTNINRPYLSSEEKVAELHKIWEAYKRSEVVVTDRLHGMIFCYITDTPCIAFLNSYHKIESSYDWIPFAKSIVLVKECNRENLKAALETIKSQNQVSHYRNMEHLYLPMIEAIKA